MTEATPSPPSPRRRTARRNIAPVASIDGRCRCTAKQLTTHRIAHALCIQVHEKSQLAIRNAIAGRTEQCERHTMISFAGRKKDQNEHRVRHISAAIPIRVLTRRRQRAQPVRLPGSESLAFSPTFAEFTFSPSAARTIASPGLPLHRLLPPSGAPQNGKLNIVQIRAEWNNYFRFGAAFGARSSFRNK